MAAHTHVFVKRSAIESALQHAHEKRAIWTRAETRAHTLGSAGGLAEVQRLRLWAEDLCHELERALKAGGPA